ASGQRGPRPPKPLTIGGPLPSVLPDMIVLEGLPALSPFRRERLELRLQSVSPVVRIVGAWHVYWVDPEPGATPDPAVLRRVLSAGDALAAVAEGAVSRFVAPRLGTISPWASKASEILRGARQPVRRVERGTRIDLAGWPDDPAAQAALSRLLHDPMTQSLLVSHDGAAGLFATPARGAFERIALAQLEQANTRLSLALAADEIEYLRERDAELGRDPSDVSSAERRV